MQYHIKDILYIAISHDIAVGARNTEGAKERLSRVISDRSLQSDTTYLLSTSPFNALISFLTSSSCSPIGVGIPKFERLKEVPIA